MPDSCPYCAITREDAWIANDDAIAIPHREPISRFHFVIAPTRHAQGFYDLDVQEQHAIWSIIGEIQKHLAGQMQLVGFDIGFQDGASPEEHTHVHVVPRIAGRRTDLPRGIEWVYSDAGSI